MVGDYVCFRDVVMQLSWASFFSIYGGSFRVSGLPQALRLFFEVSKVMLSVKTSRFRKSSMCASCRLNYAVGSIGLPKKEGATIHFGAHKHYYGGRLD